MTAWLRDDAGGEWWNYNDDLFGNTYSFSLGLALGLHAGTTDFWFSAESGDETAESYRWWDGDGPHWDTGLTVYIANMPAIEAHAATLIYYGP